LTELNKKVFGTITIKEIIGADPPAIPDTKNLLEKELQKLINNLKSQTRDDLKKLLNEQQIADKYINSRPGAMALAQDKIRLFTQYNQKYIHIIDQMIKS
jgi:RecB family exonuclease